MAAENKASDKEELIDLNERFHFYVRRVRQLRDESDLETFYKSIATLEDEVKEVRKSYESEIAKLKYAIEILNREKSEMEKDIIARKNMEAHLNDRLNVEVDKTQRYVTEISHLKNEIVDKDYQIRELNMNLNQAHYDNSGMKKDLDGKTRLADDLKRQLDLSKSEYKDTTNRLQIVEEKLSFQESFTEERMGELKRRIETYLMQIAELENKCELAEAREAAFPDQLRQVKEAADADIRKFQRDTEDFYKGSIQTLQSQLEEEIGENKKLQGEVERLNDKIVEYRNQVTELKSQITTLEQQKRVLTQSLDSERHQNSYAVNGLERKLKEVQLELQAKVNEMNQKQDVSASLRAELDAMHALIEEEETRLGIRIRPAAPINYPGGSGSAHKKQTTTTTAVVEATTKTMESTTTVVAKTQAAARTEKVGAAQLTSTITSEVQHEIVEPPKRPQLQQRDSDWQKMRFLAEETKKAGSNCGGSSACSSQAEDDQAAMHLDLHEAIVASGETATTPDDGYDEPKTPRDRVIGPVVTAGQGAGAASAVGPLQGAAVSTEKEASPPRTGSSKRHSVRNEGEGRDYFEEMFEDNDDMMMDAGQAQPVPQEAGVMQSSAIGDIKILEVNPEGKFVRVLNANEKMEAEFGNYAVQQNIGGHPIAVFRFPPHTKIKPNSTATIWAGCNPATEALHQPPTDFYWREYERFNTGPECTTVVCEPSGRSVAWTTPYHRYSKDAFLIVTPTASQRTSARDPMEDFDGLEGEPRLPQHRNLPREEPATLRREKTMPCYVASRHPHAQPTCSSVHPRCDSPRTGLWGNDNSSVNRQTRSQMTRVPDRVPGEPYTGGSNQVMGSARVMHYQASLRKSATIGNRAPDVILRSDLERPSPFSKPHSRFDDGMKQVQSMYNSEHLPPMPRPPAAVKAD